MRRIGGFADTIGTLAFSPDGAHLVVGLQGATGLRVLRTSDYAEVKQDTEYGTLAALDLGFAPDSHLRRCFSQRLHPTLQQRYQLIGRRKTTTAQQPLSIKFSPNGRYIAVGFERLSAPGDLPSCRSHLVAFHETPHRSAISGACREKHQWSDSGDAFYATGEQEEHTVAAVSTAGAKRAVVRLRSSTFPCNAPAACGR